MFNLNILVKDNFQEMTGEEMEYEYHAKDSDINQWSLVEYRVSEDMDLVRRNTMNAGQAAMLEKLDRPNQKYFTLINKGLPSRSITLLF